MPLLLVASLNHAEKRFPCRDERSVSISMRSSASIVIELIARREQRTDKPAGVFSSPPLSSRSTESLHN